MGEAFKKNKQHATGLQEEKSQGKMKTGRLEVTQGNTMCKHVKENKGKTFGSKKGKT